MANRERRLDEKQPKSVPAKEQPHEIEEIDAKPVPKEVNTSYQKYLGRTKIPEWNTNSDSDWQRVAPQIELAEVTSPPLFHGSFKIQDEANVTPPLEVHVRGTADFVLLVLEHAAHVAMEERHEPHQSVPDETTGVGDSQDG